MKLMQALVLACAGLLLAACGGHADAPPPPETVAAIVTQPADQSVVVGNAATFSVVASGAAPLAYQWAGSADGVTFTPITGATGASYSTGATALVQSGRFYRVMVANSLGSVTSSAARLTVTPAPVAPAIGAQPADQTVTTPATATFSVTATGTTLAYEWQSSSDAGLTFSPVAGANSASLAVTNTSTTQSGQRYRVRVSNSVGSVTSNAATLTVTAVISAGFNSPGGVAVDAAGNTYVADTSNHRILKITAGGAVSTLAGLAGNAGSADGTGSAARFNVPRGVAVDGAGNVYVADTNNEIIRRITPAGLVSTLAGQAGTSGGADGTASAARFNRPFALVVDAAGTVHVADTSNHAVRSITAAGVVTTLAGLAGSAGFTDGTGNAARLANPHAIGVDAAGNLYVAELNHTVRRITPAGAATTFAGLATAVGSGDGTGSAARFADPRGLAVDAAGNVYVADTANHTLRKITPAAVVSTLAGLAGSSGSADGTGSAARFTQPRGLAVDTAGNVYVADTGNGSIRKVTPGGAVTTFAQ